MKNIKSFQFSTFVFLGLLLLTTSCKEDRVTEEMTDSYEVEIQIISPSEGQTITAGQEFTVEVEYTRNGNLIHNILVEIVDTSNNRVERLVERHAHVQGEFTFKQEGIVMNEAGTYKVRAMTVDIDETDILGSLENNMVEQTFSIQ